ncbi:ADP-ribosylglycohydrolase family protein [Shewanella glacialimarina]|uniref:ADP-ribosylglycohydrolase family protein n=1 Tax=Shewanella glacialimarina TaxID=2590884 RepID=UPI001CF859F5|nr:ADP-ribosylglycohydrolase family protein [Shewanella glacialimarina]UCX04065.1 ADP-ribosylglycohydrolase family protein [Shewanella glacialimarina]
MDHNPSQLLRVTWALKTSFIADALAMPVHWYYQPIEIERAFTGGIQRFEAAPEFHPSSIMSLHSKHKGGRQSNDRSSKGHAAHDQPPQVIGDIILKDKAQFWDKPNVHYHQGMLAGENTLNAHCARVLMRTLAHSPQRYDRQAFVNAYIDFMTMTPATHPDTYAESYHRGFFANLAQGRKPENCGMITHDTASIGALVTIAPLVFSERLKGISEAEIKITCRAHLALTHPDESLMQVCDSYVQLLCGLLDGPDEAGAEALLLEASIGLTSTNLASLLKRNMPDNQVVGQVFSRACYISDSWPIVLYLACKYQHDPWQALRVNTNLGGDNVHRGIVLGTLLGLQSDTVATSWFEQLVDQKLIADEIEKLISVASVPKP